MLVQKEVKNRKLAKTLMNIDEKELLSALEPLIEHKKPQLLKTGKHKRFKLFQAIKMKGSGPTASEIVIRDRM